MKYNSRPLVLLFSILTGADVLATAAALGDIIGEKPALIFVLATKAVSAGATYYASNWVTPNEKIIAVTTPSGDTVAGQGASLPTGAPVDVLAPVGEGGVGPNL